MFSEAQLLSQLTQAFSGDYIFQVIEQEGIVEIYLNYRDDVSPNPEAMGQALQQAIADFDWGQVEQAYLLGRSLGSTEPEWEVPLTLTSETTEAPPEAIASNSTSPEDHLEPGSASINAPDKSNSDSASSDLDASDSNASEIVTEESQDVSPFHDYCFTRNKRLVTTEILPPSDDVAQLIQQFDDLAKAEKLALLPQLDAFFRGKGTITPSDESDQLWIDAYSALPQSEQRKATIWLSRYCANPEKTLTEVQAVLNPTAIPPEPKQPLHTTESSPVQETQSSKPPLLHSTDALTDEVRPRGPQVSRPAPRPRATRRSAERAAQAQEHASEQAQRRNRLLAWLIPVVWTACTFLFIVHDVQAAYSPQHYEQICQRSNAPEECQLAGQLVGDSEVFQLLIEDGKSFSASVKDKLELHALESSGDGDDSEQEQQIKELILNLGRSEFRDCGEETFSNAGYTKEDLFENGNPDLLSHDMTQVFPGLFLIRSELSHQETGKPITTACAMAANAEEVSLMLSDTIPTNWPKTPYVRDNVKTSMIQTQQAFGKLSLLGSGTLFTAAGILSAVYFGLGIRVTSLNTLYLSAFVLGIIEFFLSFIPTFGWISLVGMVASMSLALAVTSCFVKGLEIDWSSGYFIVAAGSLTIIAVRTVLNLLLMYILFAVFV